MGSDLETKLTERYKMRGASYKPRTRHLFPNGAAKYTNRLFLESSPYLLQHAHNPVNWYSWSNEAFEEARKAERPVLLSVGYSTCHWCHVMEEESFEDPEIAKYMNENYIAIKVDREERPDVDAVYMSAVQAMTGSGGWPMTVWLTPDRKPYFGGTYFPPRDGARGSHTGFLTLLKRLKEAYHSDKGQVASVNEQLVNAIKQSLKPEASTGMPTSEVLKSAVSYYRNNFDSTYGGLGRAPKFPSGLPNRMLLRYYRRIPDNQILEMVTKTLQKMAAGGMYDHVGGGFHRYSTDKQWLVPHFEKMLYDNALLTLAYLDAYQVTANPEFRRIAEEILSYVKRDMTDPLGGFYSATDADSLNPKGEREEGWYFTWTPSELDSVLTKDEATFAKSYYAVSTAGNFEGRNILNTPLPLDEVSKKLGLTEEQAVTLRSSIREKLYSARSKRPPPIRDEKILTAWNGLMISAFSQAAFILNNQAYLKTAEDAARFILKSLTINGRLFRTFKDGEAKYKGYLDDYAFLIAALLDLYEASGKIEWLSSAIELDQVLANNYEDKVSGGFYMTSNDHEELLSREKPAYDGAEPSGNSVAILNLLRLNEFTTKDEYRARAHKALQAFSGTLQSRPMALSEMLLAVDYYLDKPKEIVLVGAPGKDRELENLLSELRITFLPNKIVSVVSDLTRASASLNIVPLLGEKTAIGGKATAYVCEKRICELPTTDPKIFRNQISQPTPLS